MPIWTPSRRLRLAALALLILAAGCERPQDQNGGDTPPADALAKTAEKGPVLLTVRLWPAAPRLSDTVKLEITLDAPPEVEVTPPVFGQAVGDFLVRDYQTKNPCALKDNLRRHRILYVLDPAFAGKHLIRSIAAQYRDKRAGAAGETVTLESEPLELTVTSALGDKTPDLASLAPMSPPQPWPRSWFWILIASGLILMTGAIAGVIWWRRTHRAVQARERTFSPEETAAAELKKLMAENLHGRGLFSEFYVGLTGIVRRYIERTTGLRAPEQTTEEFLRDMRARQVFPAERSVQLAQFLEAADLVKYAAQMPGERQLEDAIGRAQDFVGLPSAFKPMQNPAEAGAGR